MERGDPMEPDRHRLSGSRPNSYAEGLTPNTIVSSEIVEIK